MSAAVFSRRVPGLRLEYGNEVALRTEAEHAADGGKRIIRSQEQFLCLVDANIPDEILNTGIGFFLKYPRKMRGGNMRVLCQLSDRIIGHFSRMYFFRAGKDGLDLFNFTVSDMIQALFLYPSIIISGINVVILCFYDLDKHYPAIMEELEKRRKAM